MSGMRTGSRVYVEMGNDTVRELVLGEMVGDGAIGAVYRVDGGPRECVKVFHDRLVTTTSVVRLPKVKEVIAKYEQGEIGGFATLPKAVVYEDSSMDAPVGYLMDYFEGVPLSELAFKGTGEPVDYRTRLIAAHGLAECVAHAHGISSDPVTRHIVIGDLSLANSLYQPRTGSVRIVDVDSFQVVGRANNKTVVYPVTEMRSSTYETVHAGKPIGKFALTSRSDNVLLAECIFRLLIQSDPLDDFSLVDVDFDEERSEAIASRRYPYIESACRPSERPESVVGDELANLFARSFAGPYDDVPTAQEYRDALRRQLDCLPDTSCDHGEHGGGSLGIPNEDDPVDTNLSGGTVLRQAACAAPAPYRGVLDTTADGRRGVATVGSHPVPLAPERYLPAFVRHASAFAPWLVLFLLTRYHIAAFLPLGSAALVRSFFHSHDSLVALASSVGFIFWRRLAPNRIGQKTFAIVSMFVVSLLCPSVFGGISLVLGDIVRLLVKLGAL